MTDHEKLREIIRATRVPPEQAAGALEKIRAIVSAEPEPQPEAEPEPTHVVERKSKGGRDRLERGGHDRSE